MSGASLEKAVKTAGLSLGLDPATVGSYEPVHHLRSVASGILIKVGAQLSGRTISAYLGHKIASAMGDNPAALVTRTFYTPEVAGEVECLIERLEDWVLGELIPLAGGDLLGTEGVEDPIDLATAAQRLSRAGDSYSVQDVQAFVQEGELEAQQTGHTGALESRVTVVSARGVSRLLAKLMSSVADTHSTEQAADLLAIDRSVLYRLIKEGQLNEGTGSAISRFSAPGFCTGSLPGGGRRFAKDEIDALVARTHDHIERRRHWLTIGEAAAVVGVSSDTIRRRADEGELACWRDLTSVHARRLLDPVDVRDYADRMSTVSISGAAALLGITRAETKAAVKLGRLIAGPVRGSIMRSSLGASAENRDGAN
ncbi:hypothetical protein BH10ACT1_BH10ACT1_34050 [soil metagenome]